MSDIKRVTDYFIRSAKAFDSLYTEDDVNPLMRFLNRKFRSDIYRRFILTLDYVRKHNLQSVLDVGCGSGRYALALYEAGVKRIVGVDVSPNMIDLSVKHTGELENARDAFEFVCSDFMDFQTHEKFDMVIAMGLFDYIENPVPVLIKMKGLSTHSVAASFPSISLYRTPLRKMRYFLKRCPVYFYDDKLIASLSSGAGFARHQTIKIKGSGMDYWTLFQVD